MTELFLKQSYALPKTEYIISEIAITRESDDGGYDELIEESKLDTYKNTKLIKILEALFDGAMTDRTKKEILDFLHKPASMKVINSHNVKLLGGGVKYPQKINIKLISKLKSKDGVTFYTQHQLADILIGLFNGIHKSSTKAKMVEFLLQEENIKIMEHNNAARKAAKSNFSSY